MFKLTPNPTFKHVVNVTVPGETASVPLTLVFKHKTGSEIDKWVTTQDGTRSDIDIISEVVVGWEDVGDGEPIEPVEFSAEALQRLLNNIPPAAAEIVRSYMKAMGESRAKN